MPEILINYHRVLFESFLRKYKVGFCFVIRIYRIFPFPLDSPSLSFPFSLPFLLPDFSLSFPSLRLLFPLIFSSPFLRISQLCFPSASIHLKFSFLTFPFFNLPLPWLVHLVYFFKFSPQPTFYFSFREIKIYIYFWGAFPSFSLSFPRALPFRFLLPLDSPSFDFSLPRFLHHFVFLPLVEVNSSYREQYQKAKCLSLTGWFSNILS